MEPFLPFFLILLIAVVFSHLFMQVRIPWVVSLIIGGILLGPNGFGVFEPTDTVDFLGTIGLVFLMFIAGLESKFSDVKRLRGKIALIAPLVGIVPALVGVGVALGLGYELVTALLVGIIFMSSAIGMLVPIFERQHIVRSELVKTIIASTVIIDAVSLVLLSVFLQFASGDGFNLAALLIYPAALALLGGFAWFLPRLKWLATKRVSKDDDMFENELQFTVLVLIGLVVFFEFVGLHAIVAGFFGGMILAQSLENPLLKAKLHAISYGFFIPVFFVSMGASTDVTVFFDGAEALLIMATIVVSLLISKFASGWLAGRLAGFNQQSSRLIGVAALPQLSTALAVAFLGFGENLLDQELLSSIVGLTIVTSVAAPILVSKFSGNISVLNRMNRD